MDLSLRDTLELLKTGFLHPGSFSVKTEKFSSVFGLKIQTLEVYRPKPLPFYNTLDLGVYYYNTKREMNRSNPLTPSHSGQFSVQTQVRKSIPVTVRILQLESWGYDHKKNNMVWSRLNNDFFSFACVCIVCVFVLLRLWFLSRFIHSTTFWQQGKPVKVIVLGLWLVE